MKKLTNLNPIWQGHTRPKSGEYLEFDCPVCPPEAKHRLTAAVDNPKDGQPAWDHHSYYWHRVGESFDEVSIVESQRLPPETRRASINYEGHWHGWIEHGIVIDASEGFPVKLQDGTGAVISPRQALQMMAAGQLRG